MRTPHLVPARFAALVIIELLFLLLTAAASSPAAAAELTAAKPTPRDKCPVCGMFVAKYPDFMAAVSFTDGTTVFFDGAKDMFKFVLDPGRYLPSRRGGDIARVAVTDYYGLAMIDGRKAFYVTGSDVFGPMGRELIPFAAEADARGFLADHGGKKIHRFGDVTAAVVGELDR